MRQGATLFHAIDSIGDPNHGKTALYLAMENKHLDTVAILLKHAGTRAIEALGTKLIPNEFVTIAKAVAVLAENSLLSDTLVHILAECSNKALALANIIFSHPEDRNILGLYFAPASARKKYLQNVLTAQDRLGLMNRIIKNRRDFESLVGINEYNTLLNIFKNNDVKDFSANFKMRYRQVCCCPWVGNIWRSDIGKKVFSDDIITEKEAKDHLKKNKSGVTAKILRIQ